MFKKILFGSFLVLMAFSSFAQDFEIACNKTKDAESNLSLYNCTKSESDSSLKLLSKFSTDLGKRQCKFLSNYIKKGTINDSDFMVFDKERKVAKPLSCYCQDKLGTGICSDKETYNQKLKKLNEPFKVKAWGNYLKDLFESAGQGGSSCVAQVQKEINSLENCGKNLTKLHIKANEHSKALMFLGKSKDVFESKNLDEIFKKLGKLTKEKADTVNEPLSSNFKTVAVDRFLGNLSEKDKKQFLGLKSSEYEKKLESLNLMKHVTDFSNMLRNEDLFGSLRQNFKGGIDFFSVTDEKKEELDRKIAISSHPDLKWLFTGINNFSNSDRERQKERLQNLSTLAKKNKFATLRELRQLYEKTYGPNCESLKKQVVEICTMDTSQTMAMAKELSDSKWLDEVQGKFNEENTDAAELKKIVDEVSCFEFPKGYKAKETKLTSLVTRSIDPKDMLDRGVEIPRIEAEVESTIDQVQGLERIAERIEEAKLEGSEPEKVNELERKFGNYLSKLEMPDGNRFNYPVGGDVAQAVASYKNQVYDWADNAVERRITNIQSESDKIINSDLPPKEKKRKLERLLDEVHRLNNGNFLEEIHQEKRKIADYISRYEDQKKKWEDLYAEEAKKNPSSVQAVIPKRNKSVASASGGAKNRSNGINTGGAGVSSAASASGGSTSPAYIPPRPSLPFAQGSLLTRIIPKNEFKNKTVKANLLAKHKGYPIAVLDEKALKVELYTPNDGTNYKLQETLTLAEAEARGYVFPEDVKKLVAGYKKDKMKGRAPASFIEYEPTEAELKAKKKKLEQLQSMSDVMERQGVPRAARVVRLNAILDNI